MKKLITCLVFLFLVCAANAATRYVSLAGSQTPPYTNWATAFTNLIEACASTSTVASDILLVTNGAYYLTNTVSITKAITLQSVNGAAVTTIDGGYPTLSNRCILISAAGTIDGFTIKNGCTTNNGGGVNMSGSSRLQNCTIISNSVTNTMGGGVYSSGSGNRITGCSINLNTATDYGGGVYIGGGIVSNCIISENTLSGTGPYGGGGIFGISGVAIWHCTVASNSATLAGVQLGNGGVGGGGTIYYSTIIGAKGGGSGLSLRLGSTAEYCTVSGTIGGNQNAGCGLSEGAVIRNSAIQDNNPNLDARACGLILIGGAIADNCVISNNYGNNYGSGVRLRGGTVRNCLIIANPGAGGGLYATEAGTLKVENCTIARNARGINVTTNLQVLNTIVQSNTVDVFAQRTKLFHELQRERHRIGFR